MPHSYYASAAVPCIRNRSAMPCPRTAGLAHVSELADDFVKDPAALFNPGQREFCGSPDCSMSNERMRGQPAPGSRLLWQQPARACPYAALHTPTRLHWTCCRLPLSPLLQAWWPACSRWMLLPTGCRWASSHRTLRTSGAARGCWGRAGGACPCTALGLRLLNILAGGGCMFGVASAARSRYAGGQQACPPILPSLPLLYCVLQ